MLLHELQATIMVVIIQNDEQLLQLTSTIISDRLEDLDQVVVGVSDSAFSSA